MDSKTRKRLLLFSLVEALYFAVFAITSYQTVFLQDKGLRSEQIGLIVSVSSMTGLVISPLWGIISDRLHSAKGTFLVTVSVSGVMYATMPLLGKLFGGSFAFFVVYIPAIFAFKQATNAMLDSWCVSELTPMGVSYGSARLWGSIGYCVTSILLGAIVGVRLPINVAFYLIAPLLLLLFAACGALRSEKKQSNVRDRTRNRGAICALLKNKQFVVYMIYALGLNIYLAVTLIFMPYILEQAGCEASQIGTVTGFRALMEIISMFVGAKLSKRIPIKYILLLPGILFGIEHLCYPLAGGLPGMLCIMLLSGLAGGFFYSLGPSYIYEIVPPEVVNTAQTFNAMNLTVVSIIGTAIGGIVIEAWGASTLTVACGVFILTLTVLFGSSVWNEKKR